jgi:hypothetical protein
MSDGIDRIRCASQALLPGGHWKTCIREQGHTAREPHVWLESFAAVGRRPILVTWYGPRTTEPMISTVLVDQDHE